MAFVRNTWRERAIELAKDGTEKLLEELVEAWNRELTPLLIELRGEVNRLGGDYVQTAVDYDVQRTDRGVIADATSGIVTLAMPPASEVTANRFFVTKTDATANTVVLDFDGSETCSGANTVTLTAQYVTVEVLSDGTNYMIASTYP